MVCFSPETFVVWPTFPALVFRQSRLTDISVQIVGYLFLWIESQVVPLVGICSI